MTRAYAVVPACGHSTRMGRPKLALPLGGLTVIERIVSTLRDGGVEALKSGSLSLPAFVPVALVMYVVILALVGVLRVFFREGYEWARVSLVVVGLFIGLFAGLIAFREDPPVAFFLLCVVTLAVDAVFVALLLHPDTTEFIRGAWVVHHEAADKG